MQGTSETRRGRDKSKELAPHQMIELMPLLEVDSPNNSSVPQISSKSLMYAGSVFKSQTNWAWAIE
jgi:hypothetical protein